MQNKFEALILRKKDRGMAFCGGEAYVSCNTHRHECCMQDFRALQVVLHPIDEISPEMVVEGEALFQIAT